MNAARLVLVGALLVSAVGETSAARRDREHQVKAAFIYNIAKYAQWSSLGSPSDSFTIRSYHADAFGNDLENTLNARSVAGHPIQVTKVGSPDDLVGCRIAVIGEIPTAQIKRLVTLCKDSETLIVGESSDLAKRGGTLGFVVIDNNVHFEVNLKSAQTDGVHLGSKLLSLATEVFR